MKINFRKIIYHAFAMFCAVIAGIIGLLTGLLVIAKLMTRCNLPQPWLGITILFVIMVGAAIGILIIRLIFFGFGNEGKDMEG